MKRGFTILELIIVVAIIVLFTGGSLAAYNSFNEEKKLQTETQKFVEALDTAKKRIISGDKSDLGSNNVCDLVDYKVKITSSLNYELDAGLCDSSLSIVCTAVDCSSGITDQTITSYNLPSTFQFIPALSTITFKPLGGGATFTVQPIRIKNTSLNKCYKVVIESSGTVYQEKNDTCT